MADPYQTIETGVASGSFVYGSIYRNYKLYEVEDYCLETGLGARNNNVFCFSKDMWESLDEGTQQLFQECANEAMAEFQDQQQSEMDGWEQEMLDNGVAVPTLSGGAKAEWAETALGYQDILQTWIDEVTALGYDGTDIMSACLQAGEKLGYEWHFDITPYIQ